MPNQRRSNLTEERKKLGVPDLSYPNPDVAMVNAMRFMKEGAVDCVKIQGA